MRKINPPDFDKIVVLDRCIDSISDSLKKNKIKKIRADIVREYERFDAYKSGHDLFKMDLFSGREADIVLGEVTCFELKDLYTSQFRPLSKPARDFYDKIRSSALYGRCPFCGFAPVGNLEHFLPKSRYPLLSILPENLVPSCGDCNTGVKVPSVKSEQHFHPYFEADNIFTDEWIKATVVNSVPMIVSYYVDPPDAWSDTLKARAQKHFESFNLRKRFSVEAATELATLHYELFSTHQKLGAEGVKKYLKNKYLAVKKNAVNDWKTALFKGLSSSTEYCDRGFMSGRNVL